MEREILERFAQAYPGSAMRSGGRPLRLRGWEAAFPRAFASADARESFLEVLERLEAEGLLRLGWKRRRVGSELEWAELADSAALHAHLGLPEPERLAQEAAACAGAQALAASERGDEAAARLFRYLAASAATAVEPPVARDLEDLGRLLALPPEERQRLAPRALSTLVFADSKRAEGLVERFGPSLAAAVRQGVIEAGFQAERLGGRTWPEASLASALTLEFADGTSWPLAGRAVSLPLDSLRDLVAFRRPEPRGRPASLRILSLENKESFRAFAHQSGPFDLVLLCGGRPNQASRAILALCARQGARIWHSGDLDADGLAIAGDLHASYGAEPLAMDCATFERYLPQARVLGPELVRRLSGLSEEVLSIGDFRALAARIAQTGRGLEQEIIDYAPMLAALEDSFSRDL